VTVFQRMRDGVSRMAVVLGLSPRSCHLKIAVGMAGGHR